MANEELKFSVKDNNGEIIDCNIVSLIPIDDEESYIVFLDGEKDLEENAVFKYGKLVKINDDFELKAGVDNNELEYIKDCLYYDLMEINDYVIDNK